MKSDKVTEFGRAFVFKLPSALVGRGRMYFEAFNDDGTVRFKHRAVEPVKRFARYRTRVNTCK